MTKPARPASRKPPSREGPPSGLDPPPPASSSHLAGLLGPDGPLAARLPGFRPRPAQQEMAERVARAIADHGIFIAESGTGTGKTFAYLVPALLSGKKVLISTGTRHLQEQLYHRDLPIVRAALDRPVTAALLKGRANYLCLYRLERRAAPAAGMSDSAVGQIEHIRRWAKTTRSGDIAEVREVPEDAEVWPLLTSTADNCLGSRCPDYDGCFVNRARRAALAADVVIVNHHLFFADLALREEGFGQLLPGVEAVIFDEAHQLPEVATQFFGVSVSSHQLVALAREAVAEEVKGKSGVEGLAEAAQALEKATADFRLALGWEPRREPWEALVRTGTARQALSRLEERLDALAARLALAAGKDEGLASAHRRALELLERLGILSESPPPEYVAWFETTARAFSLHLSPLTIAETFRQYTALPAHGSQTSAPAGGRKAWIFTSATLAIDRRFDHFQARLGLQEAQTGLWESPFDFARQTLLYLPEGLPEPAAEDYTERVIEVALPVLEASRGRAFLLFTSHRALRIAAERLAGRLDYPVLVQGEAPRSALLERFRALGNAVLLGTASFWEGVDVRGEALSCVIIDKLPFAAPDDPVLKARCRALEEAGRNPFLEYQLPEAVIALKQGVGRLIRDETDRGVLVLCDPRLLTRGYGRIFLDSLPPMPRTRALDDVRRFFSLV